MPARRRTPLDAVVAEVPMLVTERRPDVSWGRPTLTAPTFVVDAGGVASQAGISHAVESAPTSVPALLQQNSPGGHSTET